MMKTEDGESVLECPVCRGTDIDNVGDGVNATCMKCDVTRPWWWYTPKGDTKSEKREDVFVGKAGEG